MINSEESLSSMVSLPDLSTPEMNAIPLPCWHVPCLSDIWIPSHLLTSRKEPVNTWATQGVFKTLEKRGHERKIESFSVYSDSDDSEKDALQSDSDEACNLDCSEKIKTKDNSPEILESLDNFSKLQPFSVKSDISLNEILKSTEEVDINNFEFEKPDKNSQLADKEIDIRNFEYENCYSKLAGKKVEICANKKSKNAKKKNKVVKSVTLDRFLEDYTEADLQEACANSYLERIRRSQNKDCDEDPIQLRNNYEFPDLTTKKEIKFIRNEKAALQEACANNYLEIILRSQNKDCDEDPIKLRNNYEFPALTTKKEIEFIRNEKTALDKPPDTMKGIAETLSQSDKNKNIYINQAEEEISTPETVFGKFVVENIPPEVSHEEIFSFLSVYGEVKYFSLEQHGDFQKAFVEINSVCGEIDWIVECLNDTEPFGGSVKVNCYKQ